MLEITLEVAVCAFAVSALLSAWLSSPHSPLRLLDQPNHRSLHTVPTPRTGGIAILLGLSTGVGLVSCYRVGVPSSGALEFYSIFNAGLVLGTVSLVDDIWELPVSSRLLVHASVALFLLWRANLFVSNTNLPVYGLLRLGTAGRVVSLVGVMWMINLYNFMDGMDGFAGGMATIGFGALACIMLRSGATDIALLATVLAAAAVGFLIQNLPPARIFMGDVGSTALGLYAGSLILWGDRRGACNLVAGLIVFSPFIVDATVTVIRRMMRREKVWQAHREHFYQRLVLAGANRRKVLLGEYALMLTCGALGMIYQGGAEIEKLLTVIAVACLYAALAATVAHLERKGRLQLGSPQPADRSIGSA